MNVLPSEVSWIIIGDLDDESSIRVHNGGEALQSIQRVYQVLQDVKHRDQIERAQ